jgi:hypothetical protein
MARLQEQIPPIQLAEDARWQLVERIVASPPFQKSARLRELLLYVTEQTLLGHANELSEQKIGCAVFRKPPDYSPLEDSSVRVHFRQLRLRLHEYFDSVGTAEPLIVEIPKGAYVPEFRPAHPAALQSGAPSAEAREAGWRVQEVLPWALCLVLAAACAVLGWRWHAASKAPAPPSVSLPPWPVSEVFDSQHRTTIVVADANYGMLRIMAQKPGSLEEYLRADFPATFSPRALSTQSARIMKYISDSLLTSYADAATAASLVAMAGPFKDKVVVRSARDLRLRDLDTGNFILLGSPASNPWVELFQDRLNFQEQEGRVGEGPKVFVNKRPRPGEQRTYEGLRWTGTAGTDYADIALLPNPQHDGYVLILQGLQQEGTEAAGLFLSDPESRNKLRNALGVSADSAAKTAFEVLIRTAAVDGAPSSGTMVATRLLR